MLHETSGSRKNGEEGGIGTNSRDDSPVETFTRWESFSRVFGRECLLSTSCYLQSSYYMMPGSVDSLDSSSSSSDDSFEEDARLAQQEWEQSLRDIWHLLSVVLLPYAGKYFGRSFSYWGLQFLQNRVSCIKF
jgi:hypothetical protein